MNYKTQRENSE